MDSAREGIFTLKLLTHADGQAIKGVHQANGEGQITGLARDERVQQRDGFSMVPERDGQWVRFTNVTSIATEVVRRLRRIQVNHPIKTIT